MVPNGWEVKSPSKLFKLFSGFAFKSSDAKESGAKWLKIANVGIGEIKWDADSFLPEHFLLEHKKYLLTKGDIVVALTRPTLGNKLKVARLTKDSDTSLLNQRVAKIVCKDNVDLEFTFQVLRSDQFAFRINVGLLGTDPPNLSVKVLEDFTIPVPPLPEQRKIAQILSTWDRGIATTEKLIDASKQQKKALMQQLLTGKKRLVAPETGKAFEGDWEEVKLKEITQFIKDGTHGTHKRYDKGVPMLSAVNITKNHKVNFNGAPNISHDDYNKIHSKYEIDEGDILLTVVGTIGRVALVPKAMKFTLQRSVAIIRTSNKASNQFLMQVFSSNEFNNLLMSKSNSTAQAGVYLGELAKIKLLLPLLEEQEKIASVLTAADKDIELLNAELTHLKQEKKALMQQLLTGKKRVNLAQTMEVTV